MRQPSPRRSSNTLRACGSFLIFAVCGFLLTYSLARTDFAIAQPGGQRGAAPRPASTLLAEWTSPQLVLALTGEEHGYMEPCGCTGGQLGGFAKRAELFRQLREEKKWNTLPLSVGGSLNERRATYLQSKIKFASMLQGLNKMGYKAQGLGAEELLLTPVELYNQYTQTNFATGFDLPFLSANTTFLSTKELGTPGDFRVVEAGGLKVGITSITGLSTRKDLTEGGLQLSDDDLKIDDPLTVLPAVMQKMDALKPDVRVLLANASLEETKQIIQRFPTFDVVAIADPLAANTARIGRTLLVPVAEKGNHVEVVGIFAGQAAGQRRFEHARVELREEQFKDHPMMTDLMKSYQKELTTRYSELMQNPVSDPQQGSFVGVESCKECHIDAYNVWKETGHAQRSYSSLTTGRHNFKGEWVPRIHDPECLACHVTGWQPQSAIRFKSGFTDIQKTPHLANQQCENCHGAGSKHVDLEKTIWGKAGAAETPELTAARTAMKLPLTRAKETCLKCHDGDNSPTFNFETWWPKIAH